MAENHGLPAVTFSSFVTSLAAAALVHLGEQPDPGTGARAVDLGLARHTIDALGMLEEKTRGNLEGGEAELLGSVLDELRLKFVERSRAER